MKDFYSAPAVTSLLAKFRCRTGISLITRFAISTLTKTKGMTFNQRGILNDTIAKIDTQCITTTPANYHRKLACFEEKKTQPGYDSVSHIDIKNH